MNKKGAIFAIMTVIIVFLFIIGNIVYKVHNEKKMKLEEVGLATLNLIKERNDFEFETFKIGKKIEYIANQEFVDFLKKNKELNSFKDYREFIESLKLREEFKDYNIKLEEEIVKFERKTKIGTGERVFGDFVYEYKIDLEKEFFMTFDGLKQNPIKNS